MAIYYDEVVSGKGVSLNINSGDSAYNTTVLNQAKLLISSGGYVSKTTAHNSTTVSNAGSAVSTFLSGGTMIISNGGRAEDVSVLRNAKLTVSSGAVATGVTIASNGIINASACGGDSVTRVDGVNELGNFFLSGGVASNFILNSTGQLMVLSGGTALDTVVKANGAIAVSGGGIATGIVLSKGGKLNTTVRGDDAQTLVSGTHDSGTFLLSGGVATDFILYENATQHISNGGIALHTLVSSTWAHQFVSSGGLASLTSVCNKGSMTVYDGGIARDTMIYSGGSMIAAGGNISGATVGGELDINSATVGPDESGGFNKLSDISVISGGIMKVSQNANFGGTITLNGTVELTDFMTILDGTALAFDISGRTSDSGAIINDWTKVSAPVGATYSLSVSVGETPVGGSYKLAANAAAFAETITVNSGATELGKLNVGETIVAGGNQYTLAKDADMLSLTVETAVTVAATLVGEFYGYGGVFQLMSDGSAAIRTVEAVTEIAGTIDPTRWTVAAVGDFAGFGRDGLLWIEKETGYAYMQYDMTSFAEVTEKTNCLGVVGEDYTVKASGDFSGSGIDGVLMQGPAFGDPSVSLNYGLPVWAREADGSTYSGWLGALVNTWEEGDPLKGDLTDPASINANNYKYDIVGVGDFDGDGRDDVMLQNTMPKVVRQDDVDYTITGSGDVFTFLTGDKQAIIDGAPPTVAYTGCATDGWSVVGFGDFDNDGVTDALLTDDVGVAGWKMADGQRGGDFWFGSLADGYTIAGVADVNADGTADIVLADKNDQFFAWTVQNGAVTGTLAIQ